MNKPNYIPQDVWDEADAAMNRAGWFMRSVRIACARAILAERERCERDVAAMVVPVKQSNSWQLDFMRARKDAAHAIRKGGAA